MDKQIKLVLKDGDCRCFHKWRPISDWVETVRSPVSVKNFSQVHYHTRRCCICDRSEIISKKIVPIVASSGWSVWLTMAEYYSHLSFFKFEQKTGILPVFTFFMI
jgi:hypothetical protein